ncbi:FG-GAP repeat domain-containing protein [Pseudodesulfovibrio sp.]|uniref:FG-GAP repeat domain-containing protein n=1 Tax=unclassified Pseudodesulfovibrio TaxID=2661612 RepID=UPI003AFF92B9
MNKKLFSISLVVLMTTLFLAASALAQDAKKFAVLPFSYNGPQKYAYFPKAFQASLRSNLEWTGHVAPASDESTKDVPAPKSKADAVSVIKSSALDYVVSGSIAILDTQATLTLKAYDAEGSEWSKTGQMSIDEITPWLDEQSKAIQGDVFHRPGYSTTEKAAKSEDLKTTQQANAPINSAFVPANDQYQAAALNPQFRYEGGTEDTGRWRSQTFRFYSTSMVVGDGDGDGKNEVFILHKEGISAFRFEQGKLKLLDTLNLSPNNTAYLRVSMVDVNKDGAEDLVVAAYQTYQRNYTMAPEGWVKSYILSFKGGKFSYIVKRCSQFLGVLRMPPTYMPVLVAQRKGQRDVFDKRINEAYVKGDEVELGQTIPAPPFSNIFGMTYLPDGLGYKFAVIDDFHRLKVYSQTMERLSDSGDDHYNSSGLAIETADRAIGMGPGTTNEKSNTYNIPIRMIAASLQKNGKYELLVNKDLSIAARVFERYTYFSQGEIHSLAWDGVGMNLAWKTRRIKGQVSDVALADLNNDGHKQLCVLVNTFPGGLGFTKRKTVVLAYNLNM